MRQWKDKLSRFVTKTFDLPSEVMLELPRITMIGSIHAYIENHQGLIIFQSNELLLKVHNGFIKIIGSDFVLKMMVGQEILLEGKITDVTFQKEINGGKT
ncbi:MULTISPECIES: sporulation protein YqfC [Gracilibacillus]|uniref:Sporulation protein YqfC n=1 Tax=Gracilibacillus dipsosauri TaxID=178340 RepID=A0A317KY67_9BACI|nr:sporulation protein YqfC [Gracilibacillus dipsosauri]PWU68482.1 sporulation protein YqfC [Gracilibacillus dipsosauri]